MNRVPTHATNHRNLLDTRSLHCTSPVPRCRPVSRRESHHLLRKRSRQTHGAAFHREHTCGCTHQQPNTHCNQHVHLAVGKPRCCIHAFRLRHCSGTLHRVALLSIRRKRESDFHHHMEMNKTSTRPTLRYSQSDIGCVYCTLAQMLSRLLHHSLALHFEACV